MLACDLQDLKRTYEAYADGLLSLAMNLLNDAHLAEDVVQDVLVRFFQNPPTLRNHNKMRSYLATCVANRARDVYRQRQKLPTVSYVEAYDRPSLEDGPIRLVEKRDILLSTCHAMSQLPYEQREAVILKLHDDLTFRQIARMQQVSTKTAASRYRYGVEKLRALLNGKVER